MPDPFGITEGVKAVTSSINESVKASKELSKAIDGVLELADSAAKERTESRKKAGIGVAVLEGEDTAKAAEVTTGEAPTQALTTDQMIEMLNRC